MKKFAVRLSGAAVLFLFGVACVLGGCTDAQITQAASTKQGALFCAVQLNGGGAVVVTLLDAEASALAPAEAPIALIATGLGKAQVDADCAAAGKTLGGTGVAVSPPANPNAAPKVAVVPSPVAPAIQK